jgi:hypothetical protein
MTAQQATIGGPGAQVSFGLGAIAAAWRFRPEHDAIKQDRSVLSSY